MSLEQGSVDEPETSPAAPLDGGGDPSALSRDEVFDILSNQRRRHALHFLKQRNGDATELRELSAQVAAWENGKPIEQVTSNERRRVYTSLQQFHLPKLHTNDFVEYDNRRNVVELTPGGANLDVYLDVVQGRDVPWSLYYTGLSVLSVTLIGAAWIGIYPFAVLPDIAWGVFTATVFAISALAHAYQDRRMHLGVEGPPSDLREK